jgi:hypothetical protein
MSWPDSSSRTVEGSAARDRSRGPRPCRRPRQRPRAAAEKLMPRPTARCHQMHTSRPRGRPRATVRRKLPATPKDERFNPRNPLPHARWPAPNGGKHLPRNWLTGRASRSGRRLRRSRRVSGVESNVEYHDAVISRVPLQCAALASIFRNGRTVILSGSVLIAGAMCFAGGQGWLPALRSAGARGSWSWGRGAVVRER